MVELCTKQILINAKFKTGKRDPKQGWLREVHLGGEGPYWTVMLTKKKKKKKKKKYSKGDQIKEDEMEGALGPQGREEICVCVFAGKT